MEERIINKFTIDGLKMPKSIVIGDEMYVEDYKKHSHIVYAKGFRGKDEWVGVAELVEIDEGDDFVQTVLKIGYGENEKDAKTYSQGMYYQSQSAKEFNIGLDTATMYIGMGKKGDLFHTGSDGFMGAVVEIKSGNKLNGIYMELVLDCGSGYDFDHIKSSVEYILR